MSNCIEVYEMPEGRVMFDHNTLLIRAEWDNGERETWGARGHSYQQKLKSFYMLTDQWDKANEVLL